MTYRRLLIIGFCLVLFGAVVPFLMVLGVIESTLWLNFLGFGASISGLFMGMIGMAHYVSYERSSKRNRDQ